LTEVTSLRTSCLCCQSSWFCQVSVFGTISVVLIGTVFRSVLSKLLVLEKTDVSVVHFVSLYNSK